MEKKIREYEKFIIKASSRDLTDAEREKLARYHFEMMESFQHERSMHLIVALFFTMMTVSFLFIAAWTTANYDLRQEMMPLYILTILLAILTGMYIKHYYFIENHIQSLYRFTFKLSGIEIRSPRMARIAKATKEIKEAKALKETKSTKESTPAKETKSAKEAKDAKPAKEVKPTKTVQRVSGVR